MEAPLIFPAAEWDLDRVREKWPRLKLVDCYEELLRELFLVRTPSARWSPTSIEEVANFIKNYANGKQLSQCGNWIVYPWLEVAVHCLPAEEYRELRTSRNRLIITHTEQATLTKATVGIGGMSVGSQVAMGLALLGIEKFTLADFDAVALSNLNRMLFTLNDLGSNKAELVARWIYELNPYATVSVFPDGIHAGNMGEFLDGLDLLVEELDNINVKYDLRVEARRRGVPVIMVTDNGDDVIVDVERFDLEPERAPFHGALRGFDLSNCENSGFDPAKLYEAMARIIGLDLVPPEVINSVSEVGKSLYSWPQLATAAMVAGGVATYVAREIVLGRPMPSGKIPLAVTMAFEPQPEKRKREQLEAARNFARDMGWENADWLPPALR